MPKTIAAMTAEIRENNIAKGWRVATGGPGSNTLGDYIALLHTEVAEATEAYRDDRLADATGEPTRIYGDEDSMGNPIHLGWRPAKPEGVGSELADVLIRLLDAGDVFEFVVFDPDSELGDVADLDPAVSDPKMPALVTFADHTSWLHRRINKIWTDTTTAPAWALRALVTVTRTYGIDLKAEYVRKMAYNRTRPVRHGGRALSDSNA